MTAVLHSEVSLYLALELSNTNWKLAFSTGGKIRLVNVPAGAQARVLEAVALAKTKLGLPADAPVYSCYEAGRDGFWIHRWLATQHITNLVVDPASIAVNRRQRRAKTDRLDAELLMRQLLRHYREPENRGWKVVRVPSVAEEDQRRVHRERERLVAERTGHVNRIRALLVLHGIRIPHLKRMVLEEVRDWAGQSLTPQLQAELQREVARWELVEQQLRALQQFQEQRLTTPQTPAEQQAQHLMRLYSLGPISAWTLSHEFFSWRHFRNRREVGALAGLTGTPYDSGGSRREQGISKAGNARVRTLAIELAWGWLRFQPDSALSIWFRQRFGAGTARQRRVGIVALARKLLVALWKFIDHAEVPAGARLRAA